MTEPENNTQVRRSSDEFIEFINSEKIRKYDIETRCQIIEDPFFTQPWSKRLAAINMLKKNEIEKLKESFEHKEKTSIEFINLGEDLQYCLDYIDDIYDPFYGAFITMIWRAIEKYLKNCISLFNSEKIPDKINELIDKYKNYGVKLTSIQGVKYVNAVRSLNNAFKHNDNIYKPDSFPIANKLLGIWQISKNKKVFFSILPFNEILEKCEEFTMALKKIVKHRAFELIDG